MHFLQYVIKNTLIFRKNVKIVYHELFYTIKYFFVKKPFFYNMLSKNTLIFIFYRISKFVS